MAVPGETMHFHTSEMLKNQLFQFFPISSRHGSSGIATKPSQACKIRIFFLVRSILHPTTQNARPNPLGRAFNLKSPLKQIKSPFRGKIDPEFPVAAEPIERTKKNLQPIISDRSPLLPWQELKNRHILSHVARPRPRPGSPAGSDENREKL